MNFTNTILKFANIHEISLTFKGKYPIPQKNVSVSLNEIVIEMKLIYDLTRPLLF